MARGSVRPRRAIDRERFQDYVAIALIALASRAICFLVGIVALAGAPTPDSLSARDVLALMERWDAGYYWTIAVSGYDTPLPDADAEGTLQAFFPVYPLVIRGTMAITRLDHLAAGVVASTLLFVAALLVIREYVRELGMPREVGIAAVVLIAFAPHSFVFGAIYTESTFLLLLAAAMLALRRRQYLAAGVAAALLSATRPNGIIFVVFALAWTLRTMGWRPLAMPWTAPGPMLTIVLAPLGLVAYWWYCFVTTGDAFAQASAMTHIWGWAPDWPWVNLRNHFAGNAIERFWVAGSVLFFMASLLLLRFRMYEEFVFCLACFLLNWISVLPNSLVRYALVLFPIFIGLARATAGRPVALAVMTGAFAAVNGLLMAAFALKWHVAI